MHTNTCMPHMLTALPQAASGRRQKAQRSLEELGSELGPWGLSRREGQSGEGKSVPGTAPVMVPSGK